MCMSQRISWHNRRTKNAFKWKRMHYSSSECLLSSVILSVLFSMRIIKEFHCRALVTHFETLSEFVSAWRDLFKTSARFAENNIVLPYKYHTFMNATLLLNYLS